MDIASQSRRKHPKANRAQSSGNTTEKSDNFLKKDSILSSESRGNESETQIPYIHEFM